MAINKPYKTKYNTTFNIWLFIFCIIGGLVGLFFAQSLIYLCDGSTFLN